MRWGCLLAFHLLLCAPAAAPLNPLQWLPAAVQYSLVDFLSSLLSPVFYGQRHLTFQREDHSNREEFDFVIVGAGASGSALALRLTENAAWRVLLLEAGGERAPAMDVPFFLSQLLSTDANWHFVTTPQSTCCVLAQGSRCDYPAGRGVGGSTNINYMFAIRGNRRDYDNWAAMGNAGWSFADVLPYFQKVEDASALGVDDRQHRGHGGRIKLSYPAYFFDVSQLILRAAQEAGLPSTPDYNGAQQTGTARIQTTTWEGARWSAEDGYLREARGRRNLFLRTRSTVSRLVLDGARARGVRYERGGREHVAYASREVILSAGAVNSPAILLRSGIGPADHLQQLGIPVVRPLPVGHNLMDHTALIATFTTLNRSVSPSMADVVLDPLSPLHYFGRRSGPLTSTGAFDTVTFHEADGARFHTPGWPDAEILYIAMNPLVSRRMADIFRLSEAVYERMLKPVQGQPGLLAAIWRLRPSSRGRVYLLNDDPASPPQIDVRGLSEPDDVEAVLSGLRAYQKVIAAPSFQKVGARLVQTPVPGCEALAFDSDDYWRCAIHRLSITIYHQSGTNKMGPPGDPTAVVGPDLKVVGMQGLRVADASVMPLVVSGHLQIPCYMIGEKAADMIKKEHDN
ncbi:hypothetical protein R5R35_010220 [Gryllus longicercus]|uniref:Glucose-methanol-choline oxidoreductase N-terminal domain-containing protein n=1 Tax=Gryllus longicercus TaxID=2509291 RepID=A0AAN9WHY1_9ORTH